MEIPMKKPKRSTRSVAKRPAQPLVDKRIEISHCTIDARSTDAPRLEVLSALADASHVHGQALLKIAEAFNVAPAPAILVTQAKD
jgi:hypothetical protein